MPTRKKPSQLSDNEWRVMRIVWQLRKCAARDVYQSAGQQYGWAPTTAKTYLALLVQKGHLKASRVGNSFLYEPRLTLWQSLRSAADTLLEKTLGGSEGPLLAYLIQNARLDEKEIADLRAALDAASREASRPTVTSHRTS